jgi:hypothetical protein
VGEVVWFDADGRELKRHSFGQYLYSCRLATLRQGEEPKLIVTDGEGFAWLFSRQLEVERKVRITCGTAGRFLTPVLETVADLDGDGKQELVFLSHEEELVSGNNPGRAGDPPTIRHTHNLRLLVRDSRLRPVADHLLAQHVPAIPNLTIWAGPLAEGKPCQILVLGEQVLVFELTSR